MTKCNTRNKDFWKPKKQGQILNVTKTIKMEKKEGWPSIFKLIALDIKV